MSQNGSDFFLSVPVKTPWSVYGQSKDGKSSVADFSPDVLSLIVGWKKTFAHLVKL